MASVSRIDGKGRVKAKASIEFDGRWPTMSITDARSLDMSIPTYWIWSQFSIKKLNAQLSKKLTILEQQWNDPKAIKSVNIEDTLSSFDTVELSFQSKIKNDSSSVKWLCVNIQVNVMNVQLIVHPHVNTIHFSDDIFEYSKRRFITFIIFNFIYSRIEK